MNTTYTVLAVPGSKRQSARPYTHAVIGFFDAERVVRNLRAEHEANRARDRRWNTKNYESEQRAAVAVEGELYINHNGYRLPAKGYEIEQSRNFVEQHPTLDAYLAHKEEEFEQFIAKTLQKGNGPLVVLRWSQSQTNAQKGSREFERSHSDLRVVECVAQ